MENTDTLPCACCGKTVGECNHTPQIARKIDPKGHSQPLTPRQSRPQHQTRTPTQSQRTPRGQLRAPLTQAQPRPTLSSQPRSALQSLPKTDIQVQPKVQPELQLQPKIISKPEPEAASLQAQPLRVRMERKSGHLHNYIAQDPEHAWSQHMAHTMARMVESGRAKVKELVARHSELEQSKTKAQGALVSVLTLTQITELKLLLDIGRKGHRFYDFVLTLLIACISLEIFVGIIIIYIGNLHYSQSRRRRGACRAFLNWCLCCCCRWTQTKRNGNYLSVRATTASGDASRVGGLGSHIADDDEVATGCCDINRSYLNYDTFIDLERADSNIEIAKVKVADAEVKTVRTMNYIRVVEDTLKKSPGNRDLEDELNKAKAELQCSMREKEEATAEQKLAEAHQHQAFFVKEQTEDREERVVYRKGTFWQHFATYLLYFISLMNVFITTFGISGGHGNPVMGLPANSSYHF